MKPKLPTPSPVGPQAIRGAAVSEGGVPACEFTAMPVGGGDAALVVMEDATPDLGLQAPRLEGLTLHPGARLFHGSLEDLDGEMRASAYDGCLWLTNLATVARCYIPSSPGESWTSLRMLTSPPTLDALLAHNQAQLGIEFRDVDYGGGIRPKSFRYPEAYERLVAEFPRPEKAAFEMADEFYTSLFAWEAELKRRFEGLVVEKLRGLGYDIPDGFDSDATLALKTSMRDGTNRILRNEHQVGTLLEFTPRRPLVIFDMTEGGARESDLTDLDYHKVSTFRRLEAMGYDGVKITDFAQSKSHGNVGHDSIGIFPATIQALREVSRVASTHPKDFGIDLQEERRVKREARAIPGSGARESSLPEGIDR